MFRLIYKSRPSGTIDKQTIRDILYTSIGQNRAQGITGALLATRRAYLQVLEGGFQEVNDTFFRIVADGRHRDIALISFGPVDRRLFEKWSMKGFGVFDLNREQEALLMEKYGTEEDCVRFPSEEAAALALVREVCLESAAAVAL